MRASSRVSDPFARGVHADERLLDDVLAGGRVIEQKGGKTQQRPVVGAVGLGEVIDCGADDHGVVIVLVVPIRNSVGPGGRYGGDHRHATGRMGTPERADHRAASGHRCNIENLGHTSWTHFPPPGLYAYGIALDDAAHALMRTRSPTAPLPHATCGTAQKETNPKTLPAHPWLHAGYRRPQLPGEVHRVTGSRRIQALPANVFLTAGTQNHPQRYEGQELTSSAATASAI